MIVTMTDNELFFTLGAVTIGVGAGLMIAATWRQGQGVRLSGAGVPLEIPGRPAVTAAPPISLPDRQIGSADLFGLNEFGNVCSGSGKSRASLVPPRPRLTERGGAAMLCDRLPLTRLRLSWPPKSAP
jgi:hypothetical protein